MDSLNKAHDLMLWSGRGQKANQGSRAEVNVYAGAGPATDGTASLAVVIAMAVAAIAVRASQHPREAEAEPLRWTPLSRHDFGLG